MTHWIDQSVFYHIYPLGLCGAPKTNDYSRPSTARLDLLYPWLEHIAGMGINALYLGPLFESVSHGYDTTDYYLVDRRLGDHQTLASLTERAHELGIKVILDAVFNHVGRDFWAFRDVLANRQASTYCGWFSGLRFDHDNGCHDGFAYDCWDGYENLVKLNLSNNEVRTHIFGAVRQWVERYHIDGLRLDAANVMDKTFLSELSSFCKSLKPDFWLMGEVVGGDYTQWVCPGRLDSVTNYECYKGLYSSFNDHNLFEIAWSLNRQFGESGLYRDLALYSFADNHDVNRVATMLRNPAHLLPLYTLMFSMPGVPSVYYGSEFGIHGEKKGDDSEIRPALDLVQLKQDPGAQDIIEPLRRLIKAKKELHSLQYGGYRQLHLTNEQFAFIRESSQGFAVTAVNAADRSAALDLALPASFNGHLVDVLIPDSRLEAANGFVRVELPPNSAVLLTPTD